MLRTIFSIGIFVLFVLPVSALAVITESRQDELYLLISQGVAQQNADAFLATLNDEERDYIFERFGLPVELLLEQDRQYPNVCLGSNWFDSPIFVEIHSDSPTVLVGETMQWNTSILNRGAFHIPDVDVRARVYRITEPNETPALVRLVDEFHVTNLAGINSKESKDITVEWVPPLGTESGQYVVTLFVAGGGGMFPTLGLPYGDNPQFHGTVYAFAIAGVERAVIEIDRNNVQIDDKAVDLSAGPFPVSAVPPTEIVIPLLNNTEQDQNVTVEWEIRPWNTKREGEPLERFRETRTIPANGSEITSYRVDDTNFSIYFVTTTVSWSDGQEKIITWFEKTGINIARINNVGFSRISENPEEQGTLFACFHNTGSANSIPDTEIELEVRTVSGETLFSTQQVLEIFRVLTPVEFPFTVSQLPTEDVEVVARVLQGGSVVDESTVTYVCGEGIVCSEGDSNLLVTLGVAIVLLLVVVVGGVLIARRNAKSQSSQVAQASESSTPETPVINNKNEDTNT